MIYNNRSYSSMITYQHVWDHMFQKLKIVLLNFKNQRIKTIAWSFRKKIMFFIEDKASKTNKWVN